MTPANSARLAIRPETTPLFLGSHAAGAVCHSPPISGSLRAGARHWSRAASWPRSAGDGDPRAMPCRLRIGKGSGHLCGSVGQSQPGAAAKILENMSPLAYMLQERIPGMLAVQDLFERRMAN